MDGTVAGYNKVKAKLAQGEFIIGSAVLLVRSPVLMRFMGAAGYDFVFIDMEHSSFSLETVGDMCEMARASGVVPIVRPVSRDEATINKVQDVGAMGIMLYNVEDRDDIDRSLAAMRYPPLGTRGVHSGTPYDYRLNVEKSWAASVNDNMILMAQIESKKGVDNIDAILDGGGIDLVEIGRGDLSLSLGVPTEYNHPLVREAEEAVVASAKRHGVTPAMVALSREDAIEGAKRGFRVFMYPQDVGILQTAYREGPAMIRSVLDEVGASE